MCNGENKEYEYNTIQKLTISDHPKANTKPRSNTKIAKRMTINFDILQDHNMRCRSLFCQQMIGTGENVWWIEIEELLILSESGAPKVMFTVNVSMVAMM